MPRADDIAALHAEYQRLTALPISLQGREWTWWEWLKRGLTLADLRALVADKKRRIRIGELPPQSLAFRNLVGNVDYAEEDIIMLRARNRGTPKDPARAEALRSLGQAPAMPSPEPRQAGAIAQKLASDPKAAAAAFAEFQRMKKDLQ